MNSFSFACLVSCLMVIPHLRPGERIRWEVILFPLLLSRAQHGDGMHLCAASAPFLLLSLIGFFCQRAFPCCIGMTAKKALPTTHVQQQAKEHRRRQHVHSFGLRVSQGEAFPLKAKIRFRKRARTANRMTKSTLVEFTASLWMRPKGKRMKLDESGWTVMARTVSTKTKSAKSGPGQSVDERDAW